MFTKVSLSCGGTTIQPISQPVPQCPAKPALQGLPVNFTSCTREGQVFHCDPGCKVCMAAPVLRLLSGRAWLLLACWGSCCQCLCLCQGELETIPVAAAAVRVPYYKPVSLTPLLSTDEIKTGKSKHRVREDVDGQILAKPASHRAHIRGVSHRGSGAPAWGSWAGGDAAGVPWPCWCCPMV